MPWDHELRLDQTSAEFNNYQQWVQHASRAEDRAGAGFVVGLRNRRVVAWKLRDPHGEVEKLTQLAKRDAAARAEFCGARDEFLAAIARSRCPAEVDRATRELALDKILLRPLTSRRILETASSLYFSTAPVQIVPAFGISAMNPTASEVDRGGGDKHRWHMTGGRDDMSGSLALFTDLPTGNAAAHRSAMENAAAHRSAVQDGGVRQSHETLPNPEPKPRCLSAWRDFERWCEERGVCSWPASSETLAEHLRSLGKTKSFTSVNLVRAAIRSTHRSVGLADPGAAEVVEDALRSLKKDAVIPRQRLNECANLKTPSAQEAVRRTACTPRSSRRGVESDVIARSRGLADIALYSVVVETSLRFEQLASLQWRALQACDDGSARISTGPDPKSGDDWVSLSAAAYQDLVAYRQNDEPGERIFPLCSRGLRDRFTATAEAAGLIDRGLPDEAVRSPEQVVAAPQSIQPGAGTECPVHAASGRTDDRQASQAQSQPAPKVRYRVAWHSFARWCAVRHRPAWPASGETTAEYLRSLVGSSGLSTIATARAAIASTHKVAELTDPCASDLVTEAMQWARAYAASPKHGLINSDGSLTPAGLESIRRTACKARKVRGGMESGAQAWRRGIVDIALCSVIADTRLQMRDIVAMKWGALTPHADGGATIDLGAGRENVRKSVRISASTRRDLDAIASFAGPDGSIFHYNAPQLHYRFRRALEVAGALIKAPRPGAQSQPAAGRQQTEVDQSALAAPCPLQLRGDSSSLAGVSRQTKWAASD